MREFGRGNVVSFAHDDTNSFHTLKKLYKGYKQKNKREARVMADFIPLEDSANPPIQAADVAASVTHRYAIEWIENPNSASLSRLRETMYKITIWDEPFARRVLDNELKVQASV